MEFKKYNKVNAGLKTTYPKVSISKYGTITFNSEASELFGVTEDTSIQVLKESTGKLYVHKSVAEYAMPLRKRSLKNTFVFSTANKALSADLQVVDAAFQYKLSEVTIKAPAPDEPFTMFQLIPAK